MNGPTRAVVLGAGYAGLLAARALAKHFRHVTIIERDDLVDGVEPRKGVPQARLYHSLLGRGAIVTERLLPGLRKNLIDEGGIEYQFGREVLVHTMGQSHRPFDNGPTGLGVTRPFLEMHVRRRVLAFPNVEALPGRDILGVTLSADRKRVSHVDVRARSGAREQSRVPADFVVDTTGRGSAMPRWLQELGYKPPLETTVKMRMGYANRFYAAGKDDPPWKIVVLLRDGPASKRCGLMARVDPEPNTGRPRWLVGMMGWCGDYPSGDEAEFRAHARTLTSPLINDFIQKAEPLSPIECMTSPVSSWRHYEKLESLPDNLIVLGDALCTFNPIYGQGMTMGAVGASILDECLAAEVARSSTTTGVVRTVYSRLRRTLSDAWMMSALTDLRLPEVEGKRGLQSKLAAILHDRVCGGAWRDPEVSRRFIEVANMLSPPQRLVRPDMLWRMLRASASSG